MNNLTVNQAITSAREYLLSKSAYPYFIVADGSYEYNELLKEFADLTKVHVSSFCSDDSFPDFDKMCSDLVSGKTKRLLVGLGDAIALSRQSKVFSRVKDCILQEKLIVICKGITKLVFEQSEIDHKFNSRRFCMIGTSLDYSVVSIAPEIPFNSYPDFKSLLSELEKGVKGKLYAKTMLDINASRHIKSSYEALLEINPSMTISQNHLSDSMWDEFLKDNYLEGYTTLHWRTYLNYLINPPKQGYMKLVMANSSNYPEYKENILSALFTISPKDSEFWQLYQERKDIVKSLQKSEILRYIASTEQKAENRIYYLTNNTDNECFAILEEIAKTKKIPSELSKIYPEIEKYLTKFFFSGKNSEKLTSYFEAYKEQKILNKIDPSFKEQVLSYAKDGQRFYAEYSTRGSLLEKLDNSKTTLYWIDALGLEYLAYIQIKSKEMGLKINIQIARANLPTLTSLNKQFYDDWKGRKFGTKQLDNIKHNGDQSFNYQTQKYPIHLSAELKVLDNVLDLIKTELLSGQAQCVVITSDHGASRLAVIAECESKIAMATTGQHSGRCCPINEIDEKPEMATEENGFWVLANYDRFKGSRKASVEVHGGATLEEVLIPIIQLSLAKNEIDIKNLTPEIWSSWNENPVLKIYCSEITDSLRLKFGNNIYQSKKENDRIYSFEITNFKKSGSYQAEIMDGDTLLGEVSFKIEKRSGKTDSDFEDEFFK